MGRTKIEMKMLEDTNTRQVTFSKRRKGLFNKANELSILCGCEVAIVLFSLANKPYSFGHPDVNTVAAKFLQQEPNSNGASSSNDANFVRMNQQLAAVMAQLRDEEKKGEIHDEALRQYNQIELDNLQKLNDLETELRCDIKARIDEMEAVEAMLIIKEKPVVFGQNHVAKGETRND